MGSSYLNDQSEIYFLHGTSVNSKVWNPSVVQSIGELFGYHRNRGYLKLIDWNGANNTKARKDTCEGLLQEIDHRKNKLKISPQKITFVGHSHGGSIILHASEKIRAILGPESQINILSLNTPNVVGGSKLEDLSINHYHVYCKTDEVTPRGGYNKTGMLFQDGERKNWFGKPIGGEYSSKKDMGSGKEGSTKWEFDSALINLDYKDQYRFKGLSPRTHWICHRGWLEKNVNQWLPKLNDEMCLLANTKINHLQK